MTKNTLKAYVQLARLDRPIGIYLVLWPALWALWLASEGMPDFKILVVFILGTVLMRSAGCVINDYADRHLDGHVERTCQRPLATGVLSSQQALVFFGVLLLLAFMLVLFLNPLTIYLSFGAVFLASLYPFMKRHTYWPQAFLGAAFAWAVPMGFAAVTNQVPVQAWGVFAITMLWALIYDTAYALKDKRDDLKIGIKSTAILFGRYVREMIGLFQIIMLIGLWEMGRVFNLQWPFDFSLVLVLAFFIFHQWQLRDEDPDKAFKVFLNNHWVGFVVLLGIVSNYLV